MKLYFVRHGRTPANILRVYNGISNDESLSQEGIDDLNKKKDLYKDIHFDYVYASPMKRVQETLAILTDQEIDELRKDLMEMDFGDWVGVNYDEKTKELATLGYTWDDYVDPDNGETYEHLFARTKSFVDEVLSKHKDDETILIGSHGMTIAALMKGSFLKDVNFYQLTPENGLGYMVDTKDGSVEKIEYPSY